MTMHRVALYRIPAAILVFIFACGSAFSETRDPLADEIARWKNFTATHQTADENWPSLRDGAMPLLAKAEKALADNRRLFALHLLGAVRPSLAGQKFVDEHSMEQRKQLAVLEAEWKKIGAELGPALTAAGQPSLDGLPAAIRAVAEAAYSEIKVYYDASVEYGRNTVPEAGLFYIGEARAQWEFVRFCVALHQAESGKPVNPGNLTYELDQLENELLSLYKPPASIDKHPLFIRGSGMLKQARELQSAGMLHGALYRLLQARLRFTGSMATGVSLDSTEAARRAEETEKQLAQIPGDHSLARLYLEMARSESAAPEPAGGETARAVFDFVMPHYFAAMQPEVQRPPAPAAEVTVTLVRWPYT